MIGVIMLLEGNTMKLEVNSDISDNGKQKAKLVSRGPVKRMPLGRIIQAFLHSKQVKGTIHRICVNYIK